MSKLSKKSEKTPLNLKTHSNKSRNLGGLKEIGGNAYNNNAPCRTRNEVIGYDLSSSNSYAMAGRTMIHQMNTPTKYSSIHGNGAGLFASYNRSIPKEGSSQNQRIRINDLSYKNETYQDYKKDKLLVKKNVDKTKHVNVTQTVGEKKDIADFRVRSASSSKKYRYNKNACESNSPSNRISSGKKPKHQFKGNYGELQALHDKESILQSVLDRNFNKIASTEPSYVNVK